MNQHWINKENNSKCVLFFNGWGMDENVVSHLKMDGYDVLMCNDFSPLENVEVLDDYQDLYLVAWSLGVWAAANTPNIDSLNFTKAIAINGTLHPVDDNLGIPPTVFAGTLSGWNERNRDKFNMRVFGGRTQYAEATARLSARTVENQKAELACILKSVEEGKQGSFKFDCAVIGNGDLIFAPQNQMNAWKNKTRVEEMNLPHFPFLDFQSWQEILDF